MTRFSTRKQLGAVIGAVVLVGAGGWVAGSQVHSPADAAAAHSAPKAGPVTVAVQRQALTATVVATGAVEFDSPEPLSLAGAVGTGTAATAGGEGAEQRVTKAPVSGAQVKEGDVLMTVNGRPVLALQGTVPMYRALGPGMSGDDVKQLQKALRRLGFEPGGVTGTFGQGTAAAVTGWYAHKGYQAQQPSPDEQQQLGTLQQSVSSAQEALLTTTADGAGSTRPAPKTGTDGSTDSSTGSSTGSGAEAGTDGGTDSGTDKKVRAIQLKSAQKSLDMANAALSTYQASYGTKVPAGEAVFFPKLPVRLDKVTVKAGDVPSGQIGTVTSSDLVVQAVVPGSDAELLRKGMAVDLTTNEGEKAHGTVAALGADASAPTQQDGGDHEASAGTAEEGAGSETGEGDGAAADASGSTSDASGSSSGAPVQLRISVPDPGPMAGQAGASVKVTIKIGDSDGKVLTVPLAAVRTSADGKARVQVLRGTGVGDVRVTVGLSASGLVEVKPDGAALKQGDAVVVGR
ncbi:putative peptidoglycan binding protein [Streptomyces sp. 840.1]|uniref:peptidoglycan-binding domain-containing protein n=1 Tax=Streptomyces sp. 840.1 TaxID=2485152 RepID=UPI000F4A5D4D|nr:peptidoglycan-binding domain-containing protein [Streptomyces sp. 840.1]ROQ68127.1 putative peptidoglycan binding protein [Streptomyces sp. 840.1]